MKENMTSVILNTNAVLKFDTQATLALIAAGNASQQDVDSFAMGLIGTLNSSITLASSIDPCEIKSEQARVFLDNMDLARSYVRACIEFLTHYPATVKIIKDALLVGLYAEATVVPALMIGNMDVAKRIASAGVCTYIIKRPDSGLIKIGRSARPIERIKNLETGAGCKLEILAIIKKDVESELHKKFSGLHAFGEWFLDDGRISSYASEVSE